MMVYIDLLRNYCVRHDRCVPLTANFRREGTSSGFMHLDPPAYMTTPVAASTDADVISIPPTGLIGGLISLTISKDNPG